MADIVETLKQAILKSEMSRYELAHKSGVSEGVLSRFLSGERGITFETAAKIAKVLKLQLTPISDRRKVR
ncbi:MAG: helix-turn-helix transcriptional regulator [Planctomycetota bacterium]|nr:helix-turn-helix transcriptional regulator [Planctomycetota bacterium]